MGRNRGNRAQAGRRRGYLGGNRYQTRGQSTGAREGIGRGVQCTRDVAEIRGELRHKSQVTLLPGGPWWGDTVQGGNQWLVISENAKLPPLEEETEMAEGEVGGEQLTVKNRITLLGRGQFL